MTKIETLFVTAVFALTPLGEVRAETVRQHDAHEHGVSKLQIAIENNKVQFVLEAPGLDILGFEHKAQNEEQKKSIASALDSLGAPQNLFVLPDAAGCTLTSANSELESHDEEGENHTEFHVTYLFKCTSTKDLSNIAIKYFDQFPSAEEIELEAVSDLGQLAIEIPNNIRSIDLSSIVR